MSADVAAACPDELSQLLSLEAQLEEDLRQLYALEQRIHRLDGESGSHGHLHSMAMLEDLPVERICGLLTAKDFAALRQCGGQPGRRAGQLLEQLAEYHKAAPLPGPPLLLRLIHFTHCLQAARLTLSHHEGDLSSCLKMGYAVEALPPLRVGMAGAERWSPLRLSSKPHAPHRAAAGGDCIAGWHTCLWRLGAHITPHVLQLQLLVESPHEKNDSVKVGLVDSAVPGQPLFTVIQESVDEHRPFLHASIREVVKCRGARGAWAYKQRDWILGDAGSTAEWIELHFEFDWQAGLCVAMVNGRVEGPLDTHQERSQIDVEFGGMEPTVDQVRIQVPMGMSVSFAELLVG